MKSRRQRCWAIRFLPANKFWRQEFTCHHHEISSLLIAWKYCINNVHWSLAQMWRNNGVVYGVFWVWWWQMIYIPAQDISRYVYDDGRSVWWRSQMREHQKLCKLAYTLREYHSYLTVTHIPWYSGSLGSQSVPGYISTHHLDGICAVPELYSRMTNIMIRLQKTGPKSKKNRGK